LAVSRDAIRNGLRFRLRHAEDVFAGALVFERRLIDMRGIDLEGKACIAQNFGAARRR
jgi:hypothetical protein